MRYYIVLLFICLFSEVYNQSLTAVDDTFLIPYDVDSINLIAIRFNDLPNGSFIDTIIPLGNGSVSNLLYKYYKANNYIGYDSLLAIVSYISQIDTSMIYIRCLPNTYEQLNANNINALVDCKAFFSSNKKYLGFEVPKNTSLSTIYTSNVWLAGKWNDSIFNASNIFEVNRENFSAGPISNQGIYPIYYDNYQLSPKSFIYTYDFKYDRVWKIEAYDITYHQQNWNTSGYQPPQVFLDWPAHGDTSIGEAFYLAPFVDYNNDGIYNPYDGDYPKIKGSQAIYVIKNDQRGKDLNTEQSMGVELHEMFYSYSCTDSALNETVFADFKIINRSNRTYDSTYFGIWTEGDLGNYIDDYIGCDVNRNLYYFFNGDIFDALYQSKLPAQGICLLKGAKQDDDFLDNTFGVDRSNGESVNGTGFGDGIIDNEYWGMHAFFYFNNAAGATGFPLKTNDYYNYLSGKFLDSSNLFYGGYGHYTTMGVTNNQAFYMFPDSSDTYWYGTKGVSQPFYWSELNLDGFNTSYIGQDKRGFSSTGPFTFAPGDEMEFTYAYVFARDYAGSGNLKPIEILKERVDSIRSYYYNNLSPCGNFTSIKINEDNTSANIKVFPNPNQGLFNVYLINKANMAQLEIFDITGKILYSKSFKGNKTNVNISYFSKGIYIIKISADNEIFIQKVLKN